MTTIGKVFIGCAALGGMLFVIRVALFFTGGEADLDVNGGLDSVATSTWRGSVTPT